MPTVGIVGGIGPESTIEYYRLLIAAHREQQPDGSAPSILINSIDLKRMLTFIETNALADATQYLVTEVHRLARAGADIGLLAANTPHVVFDDIQRQSPIPLVSIVKATRDAATALGLTRLGLIGTRFTMRGRFYPDVFAQAGMTLAVPDEDEQAYIHDRYMTELLRGIIRPATRERLLAIANRLKAEEGIQGLILGGTELSLILRNPEGSNLTFLDTTQIHVRAVVARLRS